MPDTATVDALTLTPEQVRRLRKHYPFEPDVSWIPDVVRDEGWLAANVRYLERERERSAAAMRDLMREVRVERVRSTNEVLDLIALAVEVFAPEKGFAGTASRKSDRALQISNPRCPVYQAIEDANWHGVTACPSWHRRRGWLDALGVVATDSVTAEKKWGDPTCATIIEVRAMPPRA